ncbi:MAG: DUF72 domain-containing protein [Actinomycetota bacterium]
MMPLYVGTSGWQYRHWRASFYPEKLPAANWLEHYGARFATVEVNNTFYRLPEASTFSAWAERTPGDFVLTIKMSRYLTHVRRLREPADAVRTFLDHALELGAKLGPILLQLPPNLEVHHGALAETLAAFPPHLRLAVEFRHPSWFDERTRAILAERGAALCLADTPGRRTPVWRTARWTFLRFHEGRASPHPCYGQTALDTWARRLAEEWGSEADAFVYFNNDGRACAIRDAIVFARLAARHGLKPTRVPQPDEVRLG